MIGRYFLELHLRYGMSRESNGYNFRIDLTMIYHSLYFKWRHSQFESFIPPGK